MGPYAYRNQRCDDALRFFAKVDRASPVYAKARYYAGVAEVQLRRPPDAVRAFEEVVRAIDADERAGGPRGALEDGPRLRALARLAIGQTSYSRAVRADATGPAAWAYFMAGDHARALGDVETLRSPLLDAARDRDPEVEVRSAPRRAGALGRRRNGARRRPRRRARGRPRPRA